MEARMKRLVPIILAVAAVAAVAPVAAAKITEPVVPEDIRVPEGNKLFLVGHAEGVQIYSCNGTAWGLVAPRANLYNDKGKLLMTHFAGPSWQARDGSKVVARRDGQADVEGAIPWLRLATVSTSAGPDGDRLAGTTYIQRIATTGGLAPAAAECNSTTAGAVVEVPYTADYYFWKGRV
jgi:hypothetical protein